MNEAVLEQALRSVRDQFDLPELQIFVSEDWRGKAADGRRILRDALAEKLKALAPGKDPSSVRDLLRLPVHADYSISISHCQALGGFALLPTPHAVGFDVEEPSRVKPAIASRIAHPKDEKAPSPAHLWAAKEALFKCLNFGQQPSVIASLAIHSWTQNNEGIFTFKGAQDDSFPDPKGYGAAFLADQLIYSVFVQPSLN